ncbi:MAG: Ig-like domain-containing protein, partial [Burkholderiaceae bacterium]|nr:Ig-like domain-containing protein [Burkholderiaceae bacterium]
MNSSARYRLDGAEYVNLGMNVTVTAVTGKREAFVINAHRADVQNFAREGVDLIITFKDGSKIRINRFLANTDQQYDELIFNDGEKFYLADFGQAWGGLDGVIEPLVEYIPLDDNIAAMLLAIFGGIALLLASEDGDGGSSDRPEAPKVVSVTDDVGIHTGSLHSGDLTDDSRPTFSGTGKPGSTIVLTDDKGTWGSTIVNPNGTWSLTPGQDIDDGTHTFKVTQTDPQRQQSESEDITLTIDTHADTPTVEVKDPDGDGKPDTSGTAEPGSEITVTWPDGTTTTTTAGDDGKWSVESPTEQGDGEITVVAEDPAGNISDEVKVPWDAADPAPNL